MEKVRGFELVSTYKEQDIALPKRVTHQSAGYDLSASSDTVVPSIWKVLTENLAGVQLVNQGSLPQQNQQFLTSILVPTGVKAYMPSDEVLILANRSSNPLKRNLQLPNGIGVIDADYYNNKENEGEIFVQLINYGIEDYTIKKGDRIAQGIFTKYLTADGESQDFSQRTGGFGSSGQ